MNKQPSQSMQNRGARRVRPARGQWVVRHLRPRRRRQRTVAERLIATFKACGHGVTARTAFERSRQFYFGGPAAYPGAPSGLPGAPGNNSQLQHGLGLVIVVVGVGLVSVAYAVSLAQFAGIA